MRLLTDMARANALFRIAAAWTPAAAVFVAIGFAVYWATLPEAALRAEWLNGMGPVDLSAAQRTAGAMAGSLGLAAALLALFRLQALLTAWGEGLRLEHEVVRRLRALASAAAVFAAAALLSRPLISLALTFGAPEGERVFSVGLDLGGPLALAVAVFLHLLARLLDDLRALRDDDSLTV